jgi:hypothetical protein
LPLQYTAVPAGHGCKASMNGCSKRLLRTLLISALILIISIVAVVLELVDRPEGLHAAPSRETVLQPR